MPKTNAVAENISQYWRDYFAAHPKSLRVRSNEAAIAQWKADHPGASDIPPRVINGLTNVKSLLRHKRGGKGKGGRPGNEALSANGSAPAARAAKVPSKLLEALEDELDKCLALVTGHEGLGPIVQVLKHARRLAIMKMST
jgi:hypothetical protein